MPFIRAKCSQCVCNQQICTSVTVSKWAKSCHRHGVHRFLSAAACWECPLAHFKSGKHPDSAKRPLPFVHSARNRLTLVRRLLRWWQPPISTSDPSQQGLPALAWTISITLPAPKKKNTIALDFSLRGRYLIVIIIFCPKIGQHSQLYNYT